MNVSPTVRECDALVIGGSFAGLSSALALARSNKRVVVVDAGLPRNRFASAAHNIVGFDGVSVQDVSDAMRRDILAYPNVELIGGNVVSAKVRHGAVVAECAANATSITVIAAHAVLCYGVSDVLPDVPGFTDCWGKSIVLCPFCHAYQAAQPVVLWCDAQQAEHSVPLLQTWFPSIQHTETVSAIRHVDGSMLSIDTGGATIPCKTLFVRIPHQPSSLVHLDLFCAVHESGLIIVDEQQQTSNPLVFAAGDCCSEFQSIVQAMASGQKAGAAIVFAQAR
jgi:thioredoxin reductase